MIKMWHFSSTIELPIYPLCVVASGTHPQPHAVFTLARTWASCYLHLAVTLLRRLRPETPKESCAYLVRHQDSAKGLLNHREIPAEWFGETAVASLLHTARRSRAGADTDCDPDLSPEWCPSHFCWALPCS